MSASSPLLNSTTNLPYSPVPRAHKLLDASMVVTTIYILASYVYIEATEPKQKFHMETSPSNQLLVSMFFAIGGAYTGNIVSKLAPKNTQLPIGTVICNATFSLLSLSTNLLQAIDPLWSESLMLKAFSVNFCGAASVFSRHISGLSLLYSTSSKRSQLVLLNVMINLLFAAMVYWIALEIEVLLNDNKSDGDESTDTLKPNEEAQLVT